MEAYALVDNNVRRKMEEMLRTWTMPVPGSLDKRPVFPPDVTGPIENALMKARQSALQAQQQYGPPPVIRQRPGMVPAPYRQTPTPPTRQALYPPPSYPPQEQRYSQPPEPVRYAQQYEQRPVRQPSQEPISQWNGQPYAQPIRPPSATPVWQQQQSAYAMPDASLENLKSDIARLITVAKSDWAQNYSDSTIQTRLKALLDLQTVLETQRLPPDQLAAIRAQVDQLSAASTPRPAPTPLAQVSAPPAQGPTLSSLLGPGALAALLARTSATPQVQTPPVVAAQPVIPSPQPVYAPPAVSSSTTAPTDLLASLRAAGLLTGGSTPTPAPAAPISLPNALSGSIPPGFPPALPLGHARTGSDLPNDVELKPSSLKM